MCHNLGDRFRSVIDDAWWCGKIVARNKNAQSPFLCYKILWDNNENENLSPWDLEPLNSRSEFQSYSSDSTLLTLYEHEDDDFIHGYNLIGTSVFV